MRIYTREYVDSIIVRMGKVLVGMVYFSDNGNTSAVENFKDELLRLSTILLGQADRLEDFSNHKPGSKPSEHCLRYANELRSIVANCKKAQENLCLPIIDE